MRRVSLVNKSLLGVGDRYGYSNNSDGYYGHGVSASSDIYDSDMIQIIPFTNSSNQNVSKLRM